MINAVNNLKVGYVDVEDKIFAMMISNGDDNGAITTK